MAAVTVKFTEPIFVEEPAICNATFNVPVADGNTLILSMVTLAVVLNTVAIPVPEPAVPNVLAITVCPPL